MGALTTALELAGLASVTVGAALLHPAAGFITGGVFAVAVGIAADLVGARGAKGATR